MEDQKLLQQVLSLCRDVKAELTALKKLVQLNKQVLTLNEFCAYAGISKSNAYHLTSTGKIRHSKPNGKLIYIDRFDADDYMRQNTITSMDDIQQEANNFLITKKQKNG